MRFDPKLTSMDGRCMSLLLLFEPAVVSRGFICQKDINFYFLDKQKLK